MDAAPPIWLPPKPAIIRPVTADLLRYGGDPALAMLPGTVPVIAQGGDIYTKLLLHCDGSDASTTFTDSSIYGHTVTANGNAQIDTAQSKFGGASALFDGTGDYLEVPDHANFDLGDGDFTIDLWVRFNTIPGSGGVSFRSFVSKGWGAAGDGNYFLSYVRIGSTHSLYFAWTGGPEIIEGTGTISTGTWYHVAVVRSSSGIQMALNGTFLGSVTATSDVLGGEAANLRIGASESPSHAAFNGWFDEIRISKGVARWTSNFTPPTEAYS